YTRTKPPPAPILGPFTAVIDQILRDDRDAPPKQRHTAAQLFRRLQDEHGYPGSYPTVRRYVAAHRRLASPTFIPLAHPPGHRLRAPASRPTSATSTSTSPTAVASSPSW